MLAHLPTTLLAAAETPDTDRAWALGVVIVMIALAAAAAVLWIAAVASILRSSLYTSAGKALWILVIIAVPILGALSWFFWGRHSQPTMLSPAAANRGDQW
ncbi:PLD nuclease N-terminal domain-containing protein [Rhodococcus sp. BH5]|uniref:PLD nuclease N-terminal domain-containing protein n=1 Tax=Rhodococcus sp. BH5 TaxID=2871702 RepID=UPI0022CD7AA4|nr:PLD nuclease N-terminal domain-containing protein [Rhodococcus sp. BH5]MCZ9634937.1 PLD nuclease N-terminal domain-containing protein [Rhodococcus sp. BH5]